MITTHELWTQCTCPVDQSTDTYLVQVQTTRMLPVEEILAAARALREVAIFQEEYTQRLARQLGARVTTLGYHSGVRTRCVAF
jgi:hypothetical protein